MCGITLYLGNNNTENVSLKRKHFLELSKQIRHRGPDWNGIYLNQDNNVVITHERLSIVGVEHGSQPIIIDDKYILSVNGEIYNHKELYNTVLHNKYIPQTQSDCEVIVYLYKEFKHNCVKMLDGIFSFALYDIDNQTIFIARDPIGIIPLYYGCNENNEYMCGSEMKAIDPNFSSIDIFPPGHSLEINISDVNKFVTSNQNNEIKDIFENFYEYFKPNWRQNSFNKSIDEEIIMKNIRNTLTSAVDKRLMCDVPFGVLLSGGLDSSLIASITSRLLKEKDNLWGDKLHTFSIGLKDAPDLKYAKIVADHLGTNHHEYNFTVQEGIDSLEDLIYHLETFDVTTIRASMPMFLMSRKIKSLGIKMVLSGEGADEILGGYLYFHNAPNADEFHNECVKRVSNLHHFDCLRANKSTMSWGLEARVPFLDKSFMELAISINPVLKLKDGKEKYILRKAFDVDENSLDEPYLPDEILWRQKEQFSDGVGYNWIDGLKEYIDNEITDIEFNEICDSINDESLKPKSKEEVYYKQIFDKLFKNRDKIVPRWIPRTDWDGVGYDPSGRAQAVHIKSNNNSSMNILNDDEDEDNVKINIEEYNNLSN